VKRVIILTNGPGEVWGWARPLTVELKKRSFETVLWLLKCPFASGREGELTKFFGLDEVYGPYSTLATLSKFRHVKGDMVVQLGGDLIFGRYLSFLLRIPLICYSYGPKKGMGKCSAVLSGFDWMADKITRKTGCDVEIVGDLAKDSLDMETTEGPWNSCEGTRIVLLPGSRPQIRKKGRPFMREFVEHLSKKIPNLNVRTPFLPDLDDVERRQWEEAGLYPVTCGTGAALKGAHMAISQPGTNNFEIMHSGTPAVIALPFDFLDMVPIQGLRGMIMNIPGFGRWIKGKWLRRIEKSAGFMTWPNRMAGKEILNEIRGDFSPYDLSEFVASLLLNKEKLLAQSRELLAMSSRSPERASCNICDVVERLV